MIVIYLSESHALFCVITIRIAI